MIAPPLQSTWDLKRDSNIITICGYKPNQNKAKKMHLICKKGTIFPTMAAFLSPSLSSFLFTYFLVHFSYKTNHTNTKQWERLNGGQKGRNLKRKKGKSASNASFV